MSKLRKGRDLKMNPMPSIRTIRLACLTVWLSAAPLVLAAQNAFTDAEADGVKMFLHDHFRETNACLVVGFVDERGSRIFSAGTLDNGTTQEPNGDTIFFIGSVSKTFTALLLQDMVERGEMKL